MKLLLTSEGIMNDSIAHALYELIDKPFQQCRVVYVPTAGYDEPGDKSWITVNMEGFRKLNPLSFSVIDISKDTKDIWLPAFTHADIIVFGGGSVSYLLTWLEKSGVKEALPELLQTRIFVGISAGAMVASHTISLSRIDLLYYEKTGTVQTKRGLGYVEFEIRPHLNNEDFPKIRIPFLTRIAKDEKIPFYAIDDQTAIQVVDRKISVISEGTWKKFN